MSGNPYRLARGIRGIGFKTADARALKLGIEKTAMTRVRAGISYALTEALDEGHCGLPMEELVPLAEKLLEVPRSLVETALQLEVAEGTVVADTVAATECVFLGGLHRAERAIAERLTTLQSGRPAWPEIDPDKAIPWIEGKTGIELADGQKRAVRMALGSDVLMVRGGTAEEKAKNIHSILSILVGKGAKVLLCALKSRADQNLS